MGVCDFAIAFLLAEAEIAGLVLWEACWQYYELEAV
jgi:hypothetical protein